MHVLLVQFYFEMNRLEERNTSFLRIVVSDRFMALVHYLICAECGFEAAQFNLAFLCEHGPVSHMTIHLYPPLHDVLVLYITVQDRL